MGQGMVAPATRFAPAGPYYLLNDTFTTDRAAGAINGTDAEPGPGRRGATDTGSHLTLSSGDVVATSGGSNGDPKIYYNAIPRRAGRMILGELYAVGVSGVARSQLGIATSLGGAVVGSIGLGGSGAIRANPVGVALISVGSFAVDTSYPAAFILRTNGSVMMLKISGTWRIMWIGGSSSDSNVYPTLAAFSSGAWKSGYIRVPATPWLPEPLISDGFGATFGTTDGLGHEEGVAGGIGAGGDGESISALVGTWANAAGVCGATALSGGLALASVDPGNANILIRADVTRSAGSAGVFLRYDSADDYVYCVHNGTNVQLVKRVAATETTLINTAATYVAGAKLIVRAVGTAFRVYYNDALVGSEQTISDANLQAGTDCGLYATDTGNAFDNLTVFAVGTGGEYAALDGF